ncbi:hypothetical protein DAPPUDRAFT_104587 [Daphnia pulex]|uniref:Uncharacterized protein n=1 Tax=Daphnia pulex TaxID=6669 RepID=E9GMP7_DAPPU|nr:hypothetical protein DAPPUDRAFT_104587 [Daphnia pulex]|eukprot:EFX79134.1 hypothetical protein DAPPUDRAFT_104587 [Daphnia pulex]
MEKFRIHDRIRALYMYGFTHAIELLGELLFAGSFTLARSFHSLGVSSIRYRRQLLDILYSSEIHFPFPCISPPCTVCTQQYGQCGIKTGKAKCLSIEMIRGEEDESLPPARVGACPRRLVAIHYGQHPQVDDRRLIDHRRLNIYRTSLAAIYSREKFLSGRVNPSKVVATFSFFSCYYWRTMANRLAYSIVLTLCLIRWSGSSAVPVSETTMEPIQHEKQSEAPPLDELETLNGTEANVDDILSATATETAEPPVATTKSQPSLVVVLNPLLSPAGRTDATTSPAPVTTTPAEETVIDSATDVPATLNGTELDLENATESTTSALPWPPTPSSTAITTTAEVTATVRTTYPDTESSAESFDSGESSSSYSSVSKSASVVPWPTEPSSFAQDKTLLPLSTTPLPIPPLWPWMLFILNGNATVANRRQRDLGTYLRLNLAARLDADYNVSFHFLPIDQLFSKWGGQNKTVCNLGLQDVAINRILLTPQAIVANISVEPSHLVYGGTGAAGLEALGQGNVTLLELSGHEFQVDRIIRLRVDEIVDQRPSVNVKDGQQSMNKTATSLPRSSHSNAIIQCLLNKSLVSHAVEPQ